MANVHPIIGTAGRKRISALYDHPDWTAFVRTIRESPADDAPRLIAADWLQENGAEERAEFVRVGVERARTPVTLTCDSNPEYVRLMAVERDLLERNVAAWYGAPDDRPVSPEVVWTRGFADIITCSATYWLRHGDAVCAREPVTAVTLTTWPDVSEAACLDERTRHFFTGTDDRESFVTPAIGYLQSEAVAGLCRVNWPGVEFTLPAHSPPASVFRGVSGAVRANYFDYSRWLRDGEIITSSEVRVRAESGDLMPVDYSNPIAGSTMVRWQFDGPPGRYRISCRATTDRGRATTSETTLTLHSPYVDAAFA